MSLNVPRISKTTFPRRYHLAILAFVWILFAIYGSLVPLNFVQKDLDLAVKKFSQLPAFNFGEISKSDWVVNVLLLIPSGFFGLGAIGVDRKRRISLLSILPVIGLCGILSLSIEFSQFWFPPRNPSINDIIAQLIGASIGISLWILTGQILTDWIRRYFTDLEPKKMTDWLLQAYLLVFLFCSFLPFDLTVSLSHWHQKFENGKVLLIPFAHGYPSMFDRLYAYSSDFILLIPVGYFCSVFLRRKERPVRSIFASVSYGFFIVVSIEVIQFLVYSRFTDSTDIITGSLGILLGALLANRWHSSSGRTKESHPPIFLGRVSLIWMGISAAYMSILIAGLWYPFDFTLDKAAIKHGLNTFLQIPFTTMHKGSYFKAIEQVIRKTVLFIPLGIFLFQTVFSLSIPHAVRYIFLGLMLVFSFVFASGIELGQVMIKSHVPDLTDVLLYLTGVVTGGLITVKYQRSLDAHSEKNQAQEFVIQKDNELSH